ncbi:MAG: hypothetical protein ACJ786_03645 [Catenulispora sp.]
MSNVVSGLIVVALAALVGAAGLLLKVRLFPQREEDEKGEDVTGYVTMMVSVVFALILGLSLVSVWEGRDSASSHVSAEASSLHEISLLATALLPADQHRIQDAATAYAHYVTDTEWPAMRAGHEVGEEGWQLLGDLRTAFLSSDVSAPARVAVLSDATTQLSTLADARRGRLEDAEKRMPAVLWIGLVLGGLLTAVLTFAYGVEQRFRHLGMVMGLVAMIGFILILIYSLDNPFHRGLGTDPKAFTRYFGG